MSTVISLYGFLLGCMVGSFMNACVDRLPIQYATESLKKTLLASPLSPLIHELIRQERISMIHPVRSLCFSCGITLPWYENIPVLSYLILKGKCRHCGIGYSSRAFWVELTTGIVFSSILKVWGISWTSPLLTLNYFLVGVSVLVFREQRFIPKPLIRLFGVCVMLDISYLILHHV